MKTAIKLFALCLLAFGGAVQAQSSFTIEAPSARNNRSTWHINIPVRPAPKYVSGRVLGVSTAESVTVPAWARFAVFSADCNFYANAFGTAVVLASDVDDGTASEQNPAAWYFDPAQISAISLISAAACKVTVSFGQ